MGRSGDGKRNILWGWPNKPKIGIKYILPCDFQNVDYSCADKKPLKAVIFI